MILYLNSRAVIRKMHGQGILNHVRIILMIPVIRRSIYLIDIDEGRGFNIKFQNNWVANYPFLVVIWLLIVWGVVYLICNANFGEIVLIGVLFVVFLVWGIVNSSQVKKRKRFVREMFYRAIGLAIMPEWLYKQTFDDVYASLMYECEKNNIVLSDEKVLCEIGIEALTFPLLFCAIYCNHIIENAKGANKKIVKMYKDSFV